MCAAKVQAVRGHAAGYYAGPPVKLPAPPKPGTGGAADLACGHVFRARCLPVTGDLVWCHSCDDYRAVASGQQRRPEPKPKPEPVLYDVRSVLATRSHGGGRRPLVHLAAIQPIAQPPRGGNGGRWYRRDSGETLCYPYPSRALATRVEPTRRKASCPKCIKIATVRGLTYQWRRPAAPPVTDTDDAAQVA